jgi:crossover junction endodeoxyribonuclease RuvC
MPQRLLSLYDSLNTLMDKYKPDTVGLEKLFFGRNITNAIPVARAVGIIYLAIAQRGLHWAEYTPMQVKLAVTGTGGAEKHQVQYMVTRLLGLHEIPKPDDAADALPLPCATPIRSASARWAPKHRPGCATMAVLGRFKRPSARRG